jgi:hypothetical protein
MPSQAKSGFPSIPDDSDVLETSATLLEHIEDLPSGTTGALAFGDDGLVLIENRRICWAIATHMRRRLTDILCQQRSPPLPREMMEDVFRRCKKQSVPFGEMLVSSGLVTEAGLRAALERHNGEAVARISCAYVKPTHYTVHSKSGYDPRFVFTPTELMASIAMRKDDQRKVVARAHLGEMLVPDATGFAFVREAWSPRPLLVAVQRDSPVRLNEVQSIAKWAISLFDVTTVFDPCTAIASATWCSSTSLVAWREGEIAYAAACSTRPASTLLMKKIAQRLEARGQSASPPTSHSVEGA